LNDLELLPFWDVERETRSILCLAAEKIGDRCRSRNPDFLGIGLKRDVSTRKMAKWRINDPECLL
jgi:hypothetical protein